MDYRNLHQMNLHDVFGDSPWTQEDLFLKDRAYMKKICPKQNREMLRWVDSDGVSAPVKYSLAT